MSTFEETGWRVLRNILYSSLFCKSKVISKLKNNFVISSRIASVAAPAGLPHHRRLSEASARGSWPLPNPQGLSDRPYLTKTSVDTALLVKKYEFINSGLLTKKMINKSQHVHVITLINGIFVRLPWASAMSWVMLRFNGQNSCSKEVLTQD